MQLSRNEFEELIAGPLDAFVTTVEDLLQRNDIPKATLATVALVGGGAAIPLLTTRLGERLGAPIRTAPQPGLSAAIGAATFGQQQPAAGAAASPSVENPTQLASAAPADMTQMLPGARIDDEGPLAWSEDEDEDEDGPVPYTGPEHSGQYVRDAMEFEDEEDQRYAAGGAQLPWYKRTALVLSLAAAGAAVLVAAVLALTLGRDNNGPVQTPPSQPTPPPETVTVTEPPTSTAAPTTTAPPPPPPTTQAPVTTEAPVTTTAAPTTTYQPPATTAPPTTAPTTDTFTPPPPPRERPRWPWRRY
jgi:hypothetical protein